MSAHTRGPWIAVDGVVRQAGQYAMPIPLAGAWVEDSWQGKNATPESVANAHLCAAAPDLLAALKECVGVMEVEGFDAEAAAARAAIAKAEGRE